MTKKTTKKTKPVLNKKHSLTVGSSVLIRTVTHYFTGRIVSITEKDLVLDQCAWIADTGRFSSCISTGSIDECEYIGDGHIVFLAGIIDVARWSHELPSVSK